MEEEMQHSQEVEKKRIYTRFIQIYLSRENLPGKGIRYIINFRENKNVTTMQVKTKQKKHIYCVIL